MATPAELRERLRAKRDAQLQQQQHCDVVHTQARQAVRDLIILGYNFAQILELTKGQVSAEHLDLHYKSIGYYRRKDQPVSGTSQWAPPDNFGSPRWLKNVGNYTISLEESEPESASEEEADSYVVPEQPVSLADMEMSDARVGVDNPGFSYSAAPDSASFNDQNMESYSPQLLANFSDNNGSGDSSVEARKSLEEEKVHSDVSNSMAVDLNETKSIAVPRDSESVTMASPDNSALVPTNLPAAANNAALPTASDTHHMQDAEESRPQEVEMEDMEVQDAESRSIGSQDMELQDVPAEPSHSQASIAEESGDQAGLGQPSSQLLQAGPDDSDMDSSSADEAPVMEESIQEELRKVQEQIRTVQERKLAKEAQREAEAVIHKRTAELSDIAAKRAVLMKARHRVNLPKLTSRVSRLESKLKNAKEIVHSAAIQLKDINAQSLELEKKEIQIRNELARPAVESANVEHAHAADKATEGVSDHSGSLEEADAEVPKKGPPVKVLTAEDSPLRMFGSWRLASLGPRHWFSPSYNGRFVKDLDVREFCNVDLTGETCVDRNCEFVHYRDFEVPPSLVVEYMATRGIDRPGFKEGLVRAIRTHLTSLEASPEQLAAVIVGFRQQYDALQVLDWDAWRVTKPM